jgi:hypothetical protein
LWYGKTDQLIDKYFQCDFPGQGKPSESWRRKAMGLKRGEMPRHDCHAALGVPCRFATRLIYFASGIKVCARKSFYEAVSSFSEILAKRGERCRKRISYVE